MQKGYQLNIADEEYVEYFIEDGITGIIVPFENSEDEFTKAVLTLYDNRKLLFEMKQNAFKHSKAYSSDLAWGILKEYLQE
jgi:glycosyltransferase involved in cell wall biosynthesis